MAAFTGGKIVSAESALAIVATHTTERVFPGVMIQGRGRRNLPSLWLARSNLMAFIAGYFLMLRMTEAYPEGLGVLRSSGITTQFMASAARRNITPT